MLNFNKLQDVNLQSIWYFREMISVTMKSFEADGLSNYFNMKATELNQLVGLLVSSHHMYHHMVHLVVNVLFRGFSHRVSKSSATDLKVIRINAMSLQNEPSDFMLSTPS